MKLPTAQDLGALPVGSGIRPSGSIDAEPIARGVERLGAGLERLGEGTAAAEYRQGRYQLTLAHGAAAAAEIALRSKYAQDTDYATLPQRFGADLRKIYDDQAQTISDPEMRQQFLATNAPAMAQAQAWAEGHAAGMGRNARNAYLLGTGADYISKAQQTDDADLHARLIDAHNSQIDEAVARGDMTPVEGFQTKQRFAKQFLRAEAASTAARGAPYRVINNINIAAGAYAPIEQAANLPPGLIGVTFRLEGDGDPNAPATGSNRGVAQFSPDLERKYGITDDVRADLQTQARAVAAEATENRGALRRALGRDPTGAEFYLAHQQGQAGAVALMTHSLKPAWQVLRPYYRDDDTAKSAVRGNIPSDNPLRSVPDDQITAGQFLDIWRQRYGRALAEAAAYGMLDADDQAAVAEHAQRIAQARGATGRAAFTQSIKNDLAEADYNGAVANPKTKEDFVQAYGPDRGADAYDNYQDALRTAADKRTMLAIPLDEINSLIEAHAPKPGDPNFAAAAKRQAGLMRLRDEIIKQRDDDPARYALQHLPAVGQAQATLNAAINADDATPQSRQAAWSQFAQVMQDEQARIGIPPQSRRLMPIDHAQDIAARIASANDPKAAIDNVRDEMGPLLWPQVFHELATAGGLPPAYQAVAALDNPRDAALLGRWLRDDAKKRDAADILGTRTVSTIKEAIRSDPSVQSLLQSLTRSGASVGQLHNVLGAIDQLAFAKSVYDGDPQPAPAAIKAFTSKYEFLSNGGARVPATAFDAVTKNAAARLQGLDEQSVTVPPIFGQQKGGPTADDYLRTLKAAPTWITSPNTDALWLMDPAGRLVRDRAGSPIAVPFSAPAPAPDVAAGIVPGANP